MQVIIAISTVIVLFLMGIGLDKLWRYLFPKETKELDRIYFEIKEARRNTIRKKRHGI